MWIYIIILMIVLLNYQLRNKFFVVNNHLKREKNIDIGTICSILVLLFFSGCRNHELGVDLWNYENSFNWRRALNYSEIIASIDGDYLYYIFERFFSGLLKNFNLYLLVVAAVTIVPCIYILTKFSEIKWLTIWLYVTMGYYVFGFSSLRQSLAISFTVMSFNYVNEKKYIKSLLCVVIASCFHSTAIVILPILFLNLINTTKIYNLFVMMCALVVFIAKQELFILGKTIFGKAAYTVEATGGKIWWIAFIAMFIVGVVFHTFLASNRVNKNLFIMISVAMIIMPICFFNPALFRMCNYYSIYLCCYLPNWICSLKKERERNIVIIIIICVTAFYFLNNVLPSYRVSEYKFLWN